VDARSAWLADCIDDPRLDVADRRAALARARQALDGPADDRARAVAALRRAAFIDAPALRAALTEALVAAGVIGQDAARYLPTRGALARQLAVVVRGHRSLKKIDAETCALADAPAGAAIAIHCETFLRCKSFDPVDGVIDLTVGARGWKVTRAEEWSHPNAGEECGFPMDFQ